MKLKLARTTLTSKPESIELSAIEEGLDAQSIYYFDKENTHKDIMAMIEHFEEQGYNVYMREIRYGLSEGEFLYEVHIVH
jgi:hypothetical protein